MSSSFKVWEALRATSAASTFFDPIRLEKTGQKFVDGGLGHNNPVDLVLSEARSLWPNDEVVVVSIGTGNKLAGSLEGNIGELAKRIVELVTDTEEKAEDFQRHNPQLCSPTGNYFRFNVPGLSKYELSEYKEKPSIITHTQTYTMKHDISQNIDRLRGKLLGIQGENGRDLGV